MTKTTAKPDLARLARLLRYARPYRARWAGIVGLTLASSALALLIPWPMQVLVDHVLDDAPLSPLLARFVGGIAAGHRTAALISGVVCAGVVLFLASAVLDALLTSAWVRVGQRMVYDLAEDLFARVQRRSLAYHARCGVGDMLARISGDSWGVYAVVETLLLAPARALVMTALMLVLMVRMDWRLTLVALAVAPFIAGASYWLAPSIRSASKMRREIESRLLAHVQQTLSGIPVVQAYSSGTALLSISRTPAHRAGASRASMTSRARSFIPAPTPTARRGRALKQRCR